MGYLAIPATDIERSSEADQRRKIEKGWRDRWQFAVPVRRAWRVNRKIDIHHLAPQLFPFRKHAPKSFDDIMPSFVSAQCSAAQFVVTSNRDRL